MIAKTFRRPSAFCLSLGLTLLSNLSSADDTDIYINAQNISKANIIFMVDNSGSMRQSSAGSGIQAYNPGQNYNGPFTRNQLYWGYGAQLPTKAEANRTLDSGQNKCDASTRSLSQYGVYADKLIRFVPSSDRLLNYWSALNEEHVSLGATYLECAADYGEHGQDTSATYPVQGNQNPWAASETNAYDWRLANNYSLYTGNYLNYKRSPPSSPGASRFDVAKIILKDAIRRLSGVKVSLAAFNYPSASNENNGENRAPGGHISVASSDIDVAANREKVIEHIERLEAKTGTPLAETLYEIYQYYRGANVELGNFDGHATIRAKNDPNAQKNSNTYQSPIDGECQKNYVLYMTDGEPWKDNQLDSKITALSGFRRVNGRNTCTTTRVNGETEVNCLDDLAKLLQDEDLADAQNRQPIISYMIGFHTNQQLLQNAAAQGGGKYYTADNPRQLDQAYAEILSEISSPINAAFAPPTPPPTSIKNISSEEDVYQALFSPTLTPRWEGNLKRYRLVTKNDGTTYLSDARSGDRNILPEGATEIVEDARSYWSNVTDGPEVLLGGARSQLSTNKIKKNRFLWTDFTTRYSGAEGNRLDTPRNKNLYKRYIQERIDALNVDVNAEHFYRWLLGYDVLKENEANQKDSNPGGKTRNSIGDPLHSTPVVLNYVGGKRIIFMTTNAGFLHAFDHDTGEELIAYTARETWDALLRAFNNRLGAPRAYGLDGEITVDLTDKNNNGIIEPGQGDRAVLIFGMRRGGNNYYAIDVTDVYKNNPRMVMQWRAGPTPPRYASSVDLNSEADRIRVAGYREIPFGQTWSTPVLGYVRWNGQDQKVIFVGGGYDRAYDVVDAQNRPGNAIYMLDARSGRLRWRASAPTDRRAQLKLRDMTYSIPAKLTPFDVNNDGYIDKLYFGDLGGQLWRFDIDNESSSLSRLISGGVVLKTRDNSPEGRYRRFYRAADVALVHSQDGSYLAVAIGTGQRARPLSTDTQDILVLYKDSSAHQLQTSYTAQTLRDLSDQTNSTDISAYQQSWYIRLDAARGEKAISRPAILQGTVRFNTYVPPDPDATVNVCGGSIGNGRAYAMDVSTGNAKKTILTNTLTGKEGRYDAIAREGIPPDVNFIVTTTDDGKTVITDPSLPGKNVGEDVPPTRGYWYEISNYD